MASDNFFNRMYITTINVLSGLDLSNQGDPLGLPANSDRITELKDAINELSEKL